VIKKTRIAILLALVLSACAPTPKQGPVDELKKQELAIVMAVGVQETSQLKPGQWALYQVRSAGSTTSMSTRLAVVPPAEGGTFWIENRTITPSVSGDPQTIVSKYQIDAAAKLLQWWIAEMPVERPTRIYPGNDPSGNPIQLPKPPTDDPQSKVEIAQEEITLPSTGKSYKCTRLTSKATYTGGRETTLTTWCSESVPFPVVYRGKSYGGVVRRTYGGHTLELTMKGTDAVPELILSEK
jgi:hypothetical protein